MSDQSDRLRKSTFSATNIQRPCRPTKSSTIDRHRAGIYRIQGSEDFPLKTTIADIENMILHTGLGDHEAFSALYDATSTALFGVCLRLLNDQTEAEDALQDVFVKIWKNADLYSVNGFSPMSWLITIARNLAIDRLRTRKAPARNIEDAYDLACSKPTPEVALVQKSERARVDACLCRLDLASANSLRGAYLEGRTYQELADSAGVPINTMRSRLRRSLIKMNDCLCE